MALENDFLSGTLTRALPSACDHVLVLFDRLWLIVANGDLVIHAAGNLVLRAEKDIFLDGPHLREHGRARDGSDDALRQS